MTTDLDHRPELVLARLRQARTDAEDARASWELERHMIENSNNAAVVADSRRDLAYYEAKYKAAKTAEAELLVVACDLGLAVAE